MKCETCPILQTCVDEYGEICYLCKYANLDFYEYPCCDCHCHGSECEFEPKEDEK